VRTIRFNLKRLKIVVNHVLFVRFFFRDRMKRLRTLIRLIMIGLVVLFCHYLLQTLSLSFIHSNEGQPSNFSSTVAGFEIGRNETLTLNTRILPQNYALDKCL